MIDNLKMMRPVLWSDVEEIRNGLNNVKELGNGAYHGYLNNMHVTVNPPMLYIEGSLPRYFLQTNLLMLDLDSTRDAINSISESLHVDISDAKVTHFEFGANMVMDKRINAYLSKFGFMSRYARIQCAKSSLYYDSGGNKPLLKVIFYDKIKQAKKEKLLIPPEMAQFKHVLRYEIKLNRPCRTLKTRELRAFQLWDKEVYSKLVQLWYNKYMAISKFRTLESWAQMEGLTSTDLKEALVVHLIQKAGVDALDKFISEVKDNDLSSPDNVRRFNKFIKTCYDDFKITHDDINIMELDGKIQEIYDRNMLACKQISAL